MLAPILPIVSVGGNDAIDNVRLKPIYLCTIYNGNLEPKIASTAKAAVVYSVANEKHLAIVGYENVLNGRTLK